ncbi:MAG TPA: hypothetical protein VE861_13615 [Gemmatimonadaceae bacterium]|nr:hypothetical protein [Gemmatimonadaceae bacterium]
MTPPTPFEQARDELFQQIMRCEVIGAAPEHQVEWFTETMAYFAERYPELKPADVNDLRKLGERFVQPPKAAAVTEEAPAVTPVPSTPEAAADDALVGDETDAETAESEHDSETADVEDAETVPA